MVVIEIIAKVWNTINEVEVYVVNKNLFLFSFNMRLMCEGCGIDACGPSREEGIGSSPFQSEMERVHFMVWI
jgi:hypothetical protein